MNPYYSEGGITLYHAKAEEIVPRLPVNYFGALVFDPPCSVHADRTKELLTPFEAHLAASCAVLILPLVDGLPIYRGVRSSARAAAG